MLDDLADDLLKNSSFGLWDVLLAAAVLVAGWFASVWARRGTAKILARWSGLAPSSTNLVARLVRYAILLLTVGVVLTVLGAPLQPVLAAVIIIGIVAFLALRGIAANFGAGLVIQARRPVTIGDHIELADVEGRITELTGRAVLLLTSDGRTVRVPNTMLLEGPLTNASETGRLRNEVRVRVRAVRDLDQLSTSLVQAVDRAGVLPGSTTELLLRTSTPDHVDLDLRFWSTFDERETARSDVVRAVREVIGAAGLRCSVTSEPRPAMRVGDDPLHTPNSPVPGVGRASGGPDPGEHH